MTRKLVRKAWPFLVMLFVLLAGCGPSQDGFWYNLPEEVYLQSGSSCIGHLTKNEFSVVDGLLGNGLVNENTYRVSVVGYNKTEKELVYEYPTNQETGLARASSEAFSNWDDLEQCLINVIQSRDWEYTWTRPTGDAEIVVPVGEYSSVSEDSPPPEYYVYNTTQGEWTGPYLNDYEAREVAQNSNDGSVIYIEVDLRRDAIESYEEWQPPEALQEAELTGTSVYYWSQSLEKFYFSLEDALNEARLYSEEAKIYEVQRGVTSSEPIASLPQFVPPEGLDHNYPAELVYYSAHTSVGSEPITFLPKDSLDQVLEALLNSPGGGVLYEWKRGELENSVPFVVSPWNPNQQWLELFGENTPLGTSYWVYNGQYYESEAQAISAARNNHDGGIYYGGIVQQVSRDIVWDEISISHWEKPFGLPDDWNAETEYFVRGETAYPTLREAIKADWLKWFVGDDTIEPFFRGTQLEKSIQSPGVWLRWFIYPVLAVFALVTAFYVLKVLREWYQQEQAKISPKEAAAIRYSQRVMKQKLGKALSKVMRTIVLGTLFFMVLAAIMYGMSFVADDANLLVLFVVVMLVVWLLQLLRVKYLQRKTDPKKRRRILINQLTNNKN